MNYYALFNGPVTRAPRTNAPLKEPLVYCIAMQILNITID